MAIDLNFDEQQEMIRDTARQFFDLQCPPSVVRKLRNADDDLPLSVWRQMADLGWLRMPFPEAYGGLACSFMDMYPLYLELGRSLAPVPHLETVVLAGSLIESLGTEIQKNELLSAIGAGDMIVTPAVMEPEGVYGVAGINLAARAEGSGYRLDGTKVLVAYAGAAGQLLVAARTGKPGATSISLFLIDPETPGISAQRTPNSAGLPLYALNFSNVAVPAEAVLGEPGQAWPALNEAMMRAAVLQSAMIVGAGQKILEMTIEYAKSRFQFGEAIGKHQAVQYLVTDIAMESHNTDLLALQAAWRISTGQSFIREAALAKAAASRAAAHMTFASHEVHAGVGFMVDFDLQLYTLRGKHWEFNLGDTRYHLEQVMAAA